MRSGFVTVVGRPNVGKSTLVNRMVGTKVTITSSRPNTTRHVVRGVLHRPGVQLVFVDTPGLHRPRSRLGERLVERAGASLEGVDVALVVVDATAAIGPGDREALLRGAAAVGRAGGSLVVVVNKVDRARPGVVLERLASVAEVAGEVCGAVDVEYFALSARRGDGVAALVDELAARMPEGPPYFPDDMVTDEPEAVRVAELVREGLLRHARDELPHSISCQVTEWEWPRIRCEIVVERSSQKAIVIGRGGEVLKEVGTAVRRQLPEGAYLELYVRVEKHWPQRPELLDRLGY